MAISTSTKKQCARKIRGFRRYCWQHTQKAGLVASALIAVALKDLYHRVIPSSESQDIKSVGSEMAEQFDTANELSANIQNLNVVVAFRESLLADAACDQSFLLRLQKFSGAEIVHFEALYDIMESRNQAGERTWGFWIQARSTHDKVDQSKRGGSNYGMGTPMTTLEALPLPLAIVYGELPFITIRDLDDCELTVFFPPDIAKLIERVELIANSTRGFERRFNLLSRAVSGTDWREVDIALRADFGDKTGKISKMAMLPDCRVDLGTARIERNMPVLPEMLRLPYH